MIVATEADLARWRAHAEKYYASLFSQSNGQVNVILAAGYAGCFALWNFTEDKLPNFTVLIVAFMLGISLPCFVAWNVFSLVFMMRQRFSIHQALTKEMSPDARYARVNEIEEEIRVIVYKSYFPLWNTSLCIEIVRGFADQTISNRCKELRLSLGLSMDVLEMAGTAERKAFLESAASVSLHLGIIIVHAISEQQIIQKYCAELNGLTHEPVEKMKQGVVAAPVSNESETGNDSEPTMH